MSIGPATVVTGSARSKPVDEGSLRSSLTSLLTLEVALARVLDRRERGDDAVDALPRTLGRGDDVVDALPRALDRGEVGLGVARVAAVLFLVDMGPKAAVHRIAGLV